MNDLKRPKAIYITQTDKERLEQLVSGMPQTSNVEQLLEELAQATVVDAHDIPADVVTMNSHVRFRDVSTEEDFEYVLTYPANADLDRGKISILAPVGTALLGLKVGDEIEWPIPSGKSRALRILSLGFQPEAAGQFHL